VCCHSNVRVSQIVASQKYNNFQLEYHDPNWVDYINNYVSAGGLAVDLIECVRVRVDVKWRCGYHRVPMLFAGLLMASTPHKLGTCTWHPR
jgi:hypothetical protein